MSEKLRILHIINSFEFGGAEAMLCNLILRTDRTRFEPFVAALINEMSVAAPIKAVPFPNAVDTPRVRPGPAARLRVRQELGLDPSTPLIGLAARYDPFKDHANFLRAAAIVSNLHPQAHFLLCGAHVGSANAQ